MAGKNTKQIYRWKWPKGEEELWKAFKKITGTGIPWQFSSYDSVVSLLGSIPGQGTKILQSAQGGQNQKEKKRRANGFPGGTSGKEPACQCRRHKRPGFDPWVRKIPWRRAWQPTPVFLLENPRDTGAWWVTVHSVAKRLD